MLKEQIDCNKIQFGIISPHRFLIFSNIVQFTLAIMTGFNGEKEYWDET